MEKIQERALRFVYEDYESTYDILLEKGNHDMLYIGLQCNLDKESKLAIYRSYILSNFNCCPLVWHCCVIQNSRNIEKIQERALRFAYEDYESTYDILLKKGNHDVL